MWTKLALILQDITSEDTIHRLYARRALYDYAADSTDKEVLLTAFSQSYDDTEERTPQFDHHRRPLGWNRGNRTLPIAAKQYEQLDEEAATLQWELLIDMVEVDSLAGKKQVVALLDDPPHWTPYQATDLLEFFEDSSSYPMIMSKVLGQLDNPRWHRVSLNYMGRMIGNGIANIDTLPVLSDLILNKLGAYRDTIASYESQDSVWGDYMVYFWIRKAHFLPANSELEQALQGLVALSDTSIKWSAMEMMIEKGMPLDQPTLGLLLSLPKYRWYVYQSLKEHGRASEFPKAYRKQALMAESQMYSLLESI